MEGSPPEYEFTLISYKLVEHKQARTSMIPLLTELSGHQRLELNAAAARRVERGEKLVYRQDIGGAERVQQGRFAASIRSKDHNTLSLVHYKI
jgi:hypothetical protein